MTMHILMLPAWLFGAHESNSANGIFFLEQAQIMREYGGHKVNIYHPTATKDRAKARGLHKTENGGVEIWRECRFRVLRSRRAAIARAADCFRRRYESEHGKPDILWLQSVRGKAAAVFAARCLSPAWNAPYFIVEHSARFFSPFGFWTKRRIRRMFGGAAFAAAVSGFLAGHMREVCPDVVVLHNPVPPIFFSQGAANTNGNPFVFHSTGRLEKDKGHETVIAAFARMPPDCRLIIAGGGKLLPALQQQTRELDIDDRVKFAGWLTRETLAESLRAADAYVTATPYETFNLSLAEALACGLPCAATPTGIAKDIVGKETGALAEQFDEDSILRAMLTVHSRRYDKTEIAVAARARFSPQQYADNLTAMITAALRDSR